MLWTEADLDGGRVATSTSSFSASDTETRDAPMRTVRDGPNRQASKSRHRRSSTGFWAAEEGQVFLLSRIILAISSAERTRCHNVLVRIAGLGCNRGIPPGSLKARCDAALGGNNKQLSRAGIRFAVRAVPTALAPATGTDCSSLDQGFCSAAKRSFGGDRNRCGA